MFDTLKLIYTQDEALELVSRYEKVYNEKIEELEEENKKLKEENGFLRGELSKVVGENLKLKSDLAFKNTMLDNVSAEYESAQNVIKKLKEKLEKWEKDYKEGIIVHCRNG